MKSPVQNTARPAKAPGPRGRRWIGSLLDVRRDRLRFVERVTREYGDVVRFRMGLRHLFLFNDPGLVRQVLNAPTHVCHKGVGLVHAIRMFGDGLLTSEEELWTRQRHLSQPAFRNDPMADAVDVLWEATEARLARWHQAARRGERLDLGREMTELTFDVLGRGILQLDLRPVAAELGEHFDTVSRWAMRRMAAIVDIPIGIPTPGNRRARHALRRIQTLTSELIRQRREAGQEDDVLGRLLAADPPFSEQQLRDQLVTLMIAGHETTAAALTWAGYLLAPRPEVVESLHEEALEVLGEQAPSLQALSRLGVAQQVFQEVLRLYPPVWMISRHAVEELTVGDYRVPAGSEILISPYALHRHPVHWEQPDDFLPERFAADASPPAPWAYLPFGGGRRSCLGRHLGMLEGTFVLATIARHFRLEPAWTDRVRSEALLTLRPRDPVYVRLHVR